MVPLVVPLLLVVPLPVISFAILPTASPTPSTALPTPLPISSTALPAPLLHHQQHYQYHLQTPSFDVYSELYCEVISVVLALSVVVVLLLSLEVEFPQPTRHRVRAIKLRDRFF